MARATFTATVEAPQRGARGQRGIVVDEFSRNLGPKMLRITRYKAPHKTRRLERGLQFRVAGKGADGAEMRIDSTAVSDDGFAYTRVTRFGRGPIVARRGKALVFKINGRTIFAKRVRGYNPGRDWVYDAYTASKAELERSSFRLGQKVQAGIGA